MRKIKFRAWDNVAKEMLYCGEDIDVVFALGSEGIECTDIRNVSPSGDGVNSMEHLKYMQFTGVTDALGTEIYEGDILQPKRYGDGLFVVVWHDNGFQRKYKFIRKYAGDEWEETNYLPLHADSFKVVGNIFEQGEPIN